MTTSEVVSTMARTGFNGIVSPGLDDVLTCSFMTHEETARGNKEWFYARGYSPEKIFSLNRVTMAGFLHVSSLGSGGEMIVIHGYRNFEKAAKELAFYLALYCKTEYGTRANIVFDGGSVNWTFDVRDVFQESKFVKLVEDLVAKSSLNP